MIHLEAQVVSGKGSQPGYLPRLSRFFGRPIRERVGIFLISGYHPFDFVFFVGQVQEGP